MDAHREDEDRARGGIALVITSLDGGGAERVLSTLAGHWAAAGEDVSVVTLAAPGLDVYPLDARVRRVSLDLLAPSRHVAEAVVRGGARVLALRRALARLRPRVVVSFLTATNVVSLLAAAGRRIPVVVCERTDPRHERAGAPWAALRRLLYPRAAALVVQTRSVAGWARPLGARVFVIPNSVERPPAIALPGVDRGPLRLVALGALRPEKGFDLLVEAFARVAPAHPEWTLTIHGEGPERRRLEALVRAVRLEDRVALPGRTATPARELAAAHAFALPSHHEGFPNALLEAMACGLPVVAADCPSGPADIVDPGRNGLLVDPGDVSRLAEALERIMRSPAERARLGRGAREVVVRFAPERVLPLWDEVVRAAVGARPAAPAPGPALPRDRAAQGGSR